MADAETQTWLWRYSDRWHRTVAAYFSFCKLALVNSPSKIFSLSDKFNDNKGWEKEHSLSTSQKNFQKYKLAWHGLEMQSPAHPQA